MTQQRFLIVGGDSLVGGSLLAALRDRGHKAIGTTRRTGISDAGRLHLEIRRVTKADLPSNIDHVYLVAAISNYGQCETDPAAWPTNVEAIPRLAGFFLEQGARVTFISTNMVFGGGRDWPGEDDSHHPTIAYARQKVAGEAAIRDIAMRLGASERLNIVRLTKVVGPDTSPFPDWLSALDRDQPIKPFSDLNFAPMSLDYVGRSLAWLGEKWVPGNLHLSGAENVDYASFARRLVAALGKPGTLVQPATSTEMGVKLVIRPLCAGIGMARTQQLAGLQPEPQDDVIRYLVAQIGEMSRD
ncbi:MAG: sugar nucleotide-binding protein [Dongiaceae bacterium]